MFSQSIDKILMMQALSFYIGGMPMLFYGDELGYTNDYSYLEDPEKVTITVGCTAPLWTGKG